MITLLQRYTVVKKKEETENLMLQWGAMTELRTCRIVFII